MAIAFLPFVFPGIPRVRCAFQYRANSAPFHEGEYSSPYHGGNISFAVGDDSARVRVNREALREALGLDALFDVKQVHGVATVINPTPETIAAHAPLMAEPDIEADGMAIDRPGVGLMVKSADCQPILIAHESGRFVAGLHAGWQGNRQNFPGVAVAELCARYNVRPESLHAVRGPSLGPANAQFSDFPTEWGRDFERWYSEHDRTMNLWQLARDQLLTAGLLPANIHSLDLCTYSLHMFYSYRRAAVTGRQGSVIWINA